MYDDVKCPYCSEGQKINHDDGYGYEEDEVYTQECGNCDKTFTYQTSTSFDYDVEKAPCLNGGKHNWKKMSGAPREYFIGMFRCTYCNEEESRDPEGRKKALNELYKSDEK